MSLKFVCKNGGYSTVGDLTPQEETICYVFMVDFFLGPNYFIDWLYDDPEDRGTGGNITSVDRYSQNKKIILLHYMLEKDKAYDVYMKDTEYEKIALAIRHILKDLPQEFVISEKDGIYSIIATFADGRTVDYGEQVRSECKLVK